MSAFVRKLRCFTGLISKEPLQRDFAPSPSTASGGRNRLTVGGGAPAKHAAGSAFMKRKLKDLDLPMQRLCECTSHNPNIAYCTGGCLQCPVKDCAYYILNFSNTVLDVYS